MNSKEEKNQTCPQLKRVINCHCCNHSDGRQVDEFNMMEEKDFETKILYLVISKWSWSLLKYKMCSTIATRHSMQQIVNVVLKVNWKLTIIHRSYDSTNNDSNLSYINQSKFSFGNIPSIYRTSFVSFI